MDHDAILMSDIQLELTDGFHVRLTFDIADSAANFDDRNLIVFCIWIAIETVFDFVCNMRDDLNGMTAKVTTALLVQNAPVNLSGCHVGPLVQTLVDKTLVVSKIQIGLCTVICYKYFTMLNRVHSSRIHVDIWIKFLADHLVAACLQQTTKRCCGNTLTKTGYNAAGDKNVLYCHSSFLFPFNFYIFILSA